MNFADFDHFTEEFRNSGGKFPADLEFEVPARFNFARDILDEMARDPGKLALWWLSSEGEERKVTFAEIAGESRRVCNLLAAEGVRCGDVVLVLLPRIVPWWVINIACLRMGAIISPAPEQLREADIEYRAGQTGATCIIASADAAVRVNAVAGRCPRLLSRIAVGGAPPGWTDYTEGVAGASGDYATVDNASDDTAAIYFTSGTEGQPKMVAHTHVSFPLRSRLTAVYWLDLHDGDLHWNLSDTGWAKAGWSSLYGPWNQGAAAFSVDSPRFSPARVLDILARYPIQTMCAAPTVYRALLVEAQGRIERHSLRHCVGAGEPLNPEVIKAWRAATGITIRDGFGQTESSLLAVNFPNGELRAGSMGKPVPGYTVAVIDSDGVPVDTGTEGDLALRVAPRRPLGLFKGYIDNPDANAAARRGDWHVTGDRAFQDDDGYLWFVGRADDVIISSGYRIGPFEVESALLGHKAVAESAVVSSPHDVRGEVVKAFVVLAPGHEASDELANELQEYVKSVTAPYKYPRRLEFVAHLPKTTSGKIRRSALREAEWNSE